MKVRPVRYRSEGRQGVVKGVYSSSDDRARLTYRFTKHAAYMGSKVGGST